MMFLTQVLIGKPEALALRLHDSYAWHRATWHAFPARDGARRDFLTRLDDLGEAFRLLILSGEPPTACPWGRWQTREVKAEFLEHDSYRFQLRANPSRKLVVREQDGARVKNGRRVPLTDPDQLDAWLSRKASGAGFQLVWHEAGAPVEQPFVRSGRRGKHVGVDFRGVIRIVDRERFRTAFGRGFGSAKAFGFGMLMLEPIRFDSDHR